MVRDHRTRRQCHLTETETTNKCPKQKIITVDKSIKVNEKLEGRIMNARPAWAAE